MTTSIPMGLSVLGSMVSLESHIAHEGAVGSPVGKLFPANLLSFRIQVVPQREQYPAVSLFISAMTELQEAEASQH